MTTKWRLWGREYAASSGGSLDERLSVAMELLLLDN